MIPKDWFGGNLDIRRATEKLRDLPVGTFLLRQRQDKSGGDEFAVDLKTKTGVKHMKVYCKNSDDNGLLYFFSEARCFPTVNQLVNYYRNNDLLENFSYKGMEGMTLKIPFKNA